MSRKQHELCECGHWDGRHHTKESDDEDDYCTVCGPVKCPRYRPDPAATRDAEAEYRQLQYDARRDK